MAREILKRSIGDRREKLAAIQSHIDARGTKVVYRILASIGIKDRTLRNWLADPEKIESSTLASTNILDQALSALSESVPMSHTDYYRYTLSQMNLKEGTQQTLQDYEGAYEILHNIRPEALKFDALHIKIEDSNFPLFIINAFTEGQKRVTAEGFVFLQGDYLIMHSASEYIQMFLTITKGVNPTKDILTGVINVYDKVRNYTYVSGVAMCHELYRAAKMKNARSPEDRARVNEALEKEIRAKVVDLFARL
ncbi:hypothetical protein FHT70_006009 [Rhizobium sp. BK049]|uniref:hypothetical protein n=1 Tax=Rhizobium sp. BK049 TaxID=2587095 RepID=UPI00161A6B87|nr:hypothetical protein [Rhizobium sp. BK049]MBB3356036.1 hypothetical protein [Rhizobium sp. BK049]